MPNRILKESICTSDSIDMLSWFEEALFYRLIVNCDDFGRFDGRAAVIKSRLFPLKDGVTVKAVEAALNKLVIAGLVVLYVFEDKPYLHLPTWDKHQQIRAKRSKYPAPEDGVISHDIKCNQEIAYVPVIQSESNPNPNPNPIQRAREADDVAFEAFWMSYPRKVGKQAAKKAFDKVNVPVKTLVDAVERQKCSAQWRKENGRYIPNPATWLNQGRWEDEVNVSTGNVFADLALGGDLLE